jgi:CheY-like chemotaxis protein
VKAVLARICSAATRPFGLFGGMYRRMEVRGRLAARKYVAVIIGGGSGARQIADCLGLCGVSNVIHNTVNETVADVLTLSPDVVLSDISIDDTEGIETALRIRESLPKCVILLYSSARVGISNLDAPARTAIRAIVFRSIANNERTLPMYLLISS